VSRVDGKMKLPGHWSLHTGPNIDGVKNMGTQASMLKDLDKENLQLKKLMPDLSMDIRPEIEMFGIRSYPRKTHFTSPLFL
jgi:hypothetical protein